MVIESSRPVAEVVREIQVNEGTFGNSIAGHVFPDVFACGIDGAVRSLDFQRGVEGTPRAHYRNTIRCDGPTAG